ncbi:MAG TPA: DUF3090 family protein [Acidimicrobiales bacterium]|nr:DUF3090 family protein [Acidimicrobiales bacterium]
MSRSFDLPEADWATVGAVGRPGQRTFYLQARQAGEVVTLKLEKQHVAALAQFLAEMLSDLPAPEQAAPSGAEALIEPLEPEWPVGTLQLAYDGDADRVLIVAEEIGEAEPEGEQQGVETGERAAARVGITRSSAAMIARVGAELVSAGRPTCALCGRPIDPEGHTCPRTNGHRPR